MTKKKITNEEIAEARATAETVETEKPEPFDAQSLKAPMSDNPWELPFHIADYLTPIIVRGFKDYEYDQKKFMNACGVKELTGAERSLAVMIMLCFMNLEELEGKAFQDAFNYVRTMVIEFRDKAKAANIVRDSMN